MLGIITGAALLIGFLTPLAGIATTLFYLFCALLHDGSNEPNHLLLSMYSALLPMALVLLGPGAFSLDARLFGRREIIIPEARRPSGVKSSGESD